jgi:hypothetical protein
MARKQKRVAVCFRGEHEREVPPEEGSGTRKHFFHVEETKTTPSPSNTPNQHTNKTGELGSLERERERVQKVG